MAELLGGTVPALDGTGAGRQAAGADLRGTVALVTGGARGLGRDMADALLAAGASVVVADVAPDPATPPHPRRAVIEADIATEAGAEAAMRTCLDTFGRLDVVVNNAGVLMRTAKARVGVTGRLNFWDCDPGTVRFFLDVHAVGSFLVARAAVPYLVGQGRGRIVTVSTSFSTMLRGGRTPYGPAKAAMEAFAAIMAEDLAGTGVTVNVLIPGHTPGEPRPPGLLYGPAALTRSRNRGHAIADPPFLDPTAGVDQSGSDGKKPVPRVPRGIMGPPIVWLASAASDGLTGRRFIAALWDPSLPPAEAAAASGAPIAWASLDR